MCRRDMGVSRSDAQDRLAGALRALALRNRQRLTAMEA
jgi:hypothetical protein